MTPKIADSEWLIMNALWDSSPQTARQLAAAIGPEREWSERTVKTLLNRLVKKSALAFDVDGKRYLYRPAVSRDECVHAEGRSFMDRVFGGAASPLLAHFLERSSLSADEIEELEQLLRAAKEDKR